MTTEVLRNMMYAGSRTLDGLGYVVMDEVHYLADRFRGAVWEEVIIHLPEHVQVVSLSATVSNAEEFGDWLAEVRGNHEVVVSEHRPVPLFQHMLVGTTMFDLFAGNRVNPDLLTAIRTAEERGRWQDEPRRGSGRGGPPARHASAAADAVAAVAVAGPGGGAGGRGFARGGRPGGGATRAEVIERARPRRPAARRSPSSSAGSGCEAAVGQLLAAGTRLIPEREGLRIRRHVEERVESLADEDLSVLGYFDFVEGLSRGFAAHHAGMLPLFREIVEELFTAARIRAVFATETLALGINMPARTVVLEKLVKFNGEAHVDITPAEYTQLTGRAGRRGIDIEGHAVVQWARGVDPLAVGGPRLDPHLPAALQLPADLQHGGQPRRAGRARGGPRDPRDLVRPVPGRPGRRRHRDRGAPQRGGARGLRRGDALPPRRLPRVRRPAPLPRRRREGRGQGALGLPTGRGRGVAWRRCGSATSSASRPVDAPGGPSSCSRPARARAPRPGRASSPRTSSSAG